MMRWDQMRQSSNVEDRRGIGGIAGLGIGGTIIVGVISLLMGANPLEVLGLLQQQTQDPHRQPVTQDASTKFVSAVLGDTEDTWGSIFQRAGRQYAQPKLVLFRDYVQSACGQASSAVGPFYCPGDNQVYLDLGFFDELQRRFAAPGDFAQAYVIAHEIGHHVQNQLGISEKVHRESARLGALQANGLSVRQELQADCFAGVWGHYAQQRGLLEVGDIDEALAAAHAIGDDTLQQQAQGHVVPDSFTHGTSAQRAAWFKKGFESGNPDQCDTFSAPSL